MLWTADVTLQTFSPTSHATTTRCLKRLALITSKQGADLSTTGIETRRRLSYREDENKLSGITTQDNTVS